MFLLCVLFEAVSECLIVIVQLVACKAEALLRLHQIKDSDLCLSTIQRLDHHHHHHHTQAKLFGMLCDAYVLCVQAQVDMALGR